jgi:polyisoprenoid-binding protein YceI
MARWQSSAKWALVAVVAVVVIGSGAFYWLFLRDDAPERASIPVRATDTTATATAGGAGPAASGVDGTYRVSPGEDVFAGYRVQEQFGGETIEVTAVGRTPAVTGSLTIADGQVTAVQVEVDVTQLSSDRSQRDNAIRDRGLETDTFRTATFVLTAPIDLPDDVPAGQELELAATGDLTLHGVTRQVTFPLAAQWDGSGSVSVATPQGIPIVMADYDIEPPSSGFVSVDDEGEIELQLVFTR